MPQCCAVPMCSNKTGGHKFPKNKFRLDQWLQAIRRDRYTPTDHSLVCKDHFTKDDYELPKDSVLEKPRLVLKKTAVPSKFSWNEASTVEQHLDQNIRKKRRLNSVQKTIKKESDSTKDMDSFPCTEDSRRCYTCLQQDRELKPLKAHAKYLFTILCPEMFYETKDTAEYLICWECEFMADKITRFQDKLKKANQILKRSLKGEATIVEGLSGQKITDIETISITPQTSQNQPNLPQNLPIQPHNLPIQPQNPYNLPILTQNPPFIISPQNILQLSLKDMLEAPSKLQPQTKIKIEAEDEDSYSNDFLEQGSCSQDFDDMIHPTNIQHVSIDPLIVPRQDQPMSWPEIEVSPLLPTRVKEEIISPYTLPQDTFLEEQIPLRGLKEAVKVIVKTPNVTTKDTNLVSKDETSVKCQRKNDLLTKLLSNPVKGEEFFLTGQRIPNEPESSKQSCDEDEAKLIILNSTELEELRAKRRSHHAFVGSKYKCDKCIDFYQSQEKIDEHNLKHDESRGNSICSICEQRFADEHVLNDHYKGHFISKTSPLLSPASKKPKTSAERQREYRLRQKLKILTHFEEEQRKKNRAADYMYISSKTRPVLSPASKKPKTSAERQREYRFRQKLKILTDVEEEQRKQNRASNFISSMYISSKTSPLPSPASKKPKTSAERQREYRFRQKQKILTAVEEEKRKKNQQKKITNQRLSRHEKQKEKKKNKPAKKTNAEYQQEYRLRKKLAKHKLDLHTKGSVP